MEAREDLLRQVEAGAIPPLAALRALSSLRPAGVAEATRQPSLPPAKATLEEALAPLDRLIGLREIKEIVRELYAHAVVSSWRERAGLRTGPVTLHMAFSGNPGTGKTTVARLLAHALRDLGVLEKGHLVETSRVDLVGEYIGHTAQRTRTAVERARGGVLFVDEAYALARGGDKDFGKEAIDTLVKCMEDHRHDLVLIFAGYSSEMNRFLEANPGLSSRVALQLAFPDYTLPELTAIAVRMAEEREYAPTEGAMRALPGILARISLATGEGHGNARMVRNLIEKAIRRQAVRLLGLPSSATPSFGWDELRRLERSDFEEAWPSLVASPVRKSDQRGTGA